MGKNFPRYYNTRPSNKKCVIQIEECKIELSKCARLPTYD